MLAPWNSGDDTSARRTLDRTDAPVVVLYEVDGSAAEAFKVPMFGASEPARRTASDSRAFDANILGVVGRSRLTGAATAVRRRWHRCYSLHLGQNVIDVIDFTFSQS